MLRLLLRLSEESDLSDLGETRFSFDVEEDMHDEVEAKREVKLLRFWLLRGL